MNTKELANRYREAWLIARRVPSGIHLEYSRFWPEIQPNHWEVYLSEGCRIKPLLPSAGSVERMIECMRWLRWINERERELIWLRASGLPWRVIAQELGVNRKTAYSRWRKAVNKISIHLLQKAAG